MVEWSLRELHVTDETCRGSSGRCCFSCTEGMSHVPIFSDSCMFRSFLLFIARV